MFFNMFFTMFFTAPLFKSSRAEFLTAAVFVGMLIGGLIAGSAADRLGRRSCLLVSLSVNFIFAVASAAAPSVGWLIAARVFAGIGQSQDTASEPR